MGWLQPGFEARVVDDDDVELPPGEAGELVLRADEPFAFASGYFGMPEKTVEAWRNLLVPHRRPRRARRRRRASASSTGIKDAIRRRGENISSYEVEQVLLSHPAVAARGGLSGALRAGRGRGDGGAGARAPASALDPAELARFCEARLPYFAIPRFVDLVDDLPRTENGKVQKFKLRERGVTPTAWDREAETALARRAAFD